MSSAASAGGACYENGWGGFPASQPGVPQAYGDGVAASGAVVCAKLPEMFVEGVPVLSEDDGYGLLLGFGVALAVLVWTAGVLEHRYLGTAVSYETFATARRVASLGSGAASVVSTRATPVAVLLSASAAWKYGAAGAFWASAGGAVALFGFACVAVELKRVAPNAHSVGELVHARWGIAGHVVFMYFFVLTNLFLLGTACMAASQAFHQLAGVDESFGAFGLPILTSLSVVVGGMKSHMLLGYLHAAVILLACVVFMYTVYADDNTPALGSPDATYDRLLAVASSARECYTQASPGVYGEIAVRPGQNCGGVEGNEGGSFLTFFSEKALVFGVSQLFSSLYIFVDQSMWQAALAIEPVSVGPAFVLAGLAWLTVPLSLGASLGLAAVALDLPVTVTEANDGFVLAAASQFILGEDGVKLVLIVIFASAAATVSAMQNALASLWTTEVYRLHIKPDATQPELLSASRHAVVATGLLGGAVAAILYECVGASLWLLHQAVGILVGSAAPPLILLLTWSKATADGAIFAAIMGKTCGIITWLCVAHRMDDDIGERSLSNVYACAYANICAVTVSLTMHILSSLREPSSFDLNALAAMLPIRKDYAASVEDRAAGVPVDFKADACVDAVELDDLQQGLFAARRRTARWAGVLAFIVAVAWPCLTLPVGCSDDDGAECGIFTSDYFSLFVVVVFGAVCLSAVCVVVLPLFEHWRLLFAVVQGLVTNDDVHRRLDDLERKLDRVLGEDAAPPVGRSVAEPFYRARLLLRRAADERQRYE